MTYEVTSESSDVNVSSDVNTTTANTITASLTGHVSATNPIIVRAAVVFIMAVINVGGNGFTLITIRLTPRLWTKTNFILASMLASDVLTGLFMTPRLWTKTNFILASMLASDVLTGVFMTPRLWTKTNFILASMLASDVLTGLIMTPRLWTKTNFILASMLASDVLTGVFMFWYAPFLIVVYVFNNPCRYNVAITVTTWLYLMPGCVSIYHLILIPVERYIAIVYPLHYETKFSDRTLKRAISACWLIGNLLTMTYVLWLIDADLSKCDLIPDQYPVIVVPVAYIPVCVTMFICYGKILAIAWRHHRRIEHLNVADPAVGNADHAIATTTTTQSGRENPTENPPANTDPPPRPAVCDGTESADLAEQQRQKMKSRRREFKAVYLTGAIVGTFVILWFPYVLGLVLGAVGFNNAAIVDYLHLVGGGLGTLNFAFSWAIYAAVSRKYRRAYRQMLMRIGCRCCQNVAPPAANSLTV